MNNISVVNLGSIATTLHALIPDIPASISGTELLGIVDRQRLFVENFTNLTVGSVSIAERFQGILVDLSAAEVLRFMLAQGVDANSVSLGPFSITKGGDSNLSNMSNYFKGSGMERLRLLGFRLDSAYTI